jgi:starvation-inducible DNA-binding protein
MERFDMAHVEHSHTTRQATKKTTPVAQLKQPKERDLGAMIAISRALNALLADSFALYLKTKNFHWHVIGPHFRPYHLLFDEHAEELFASTDELADRVRDISGPATLAAREVNELRRVKDKGRSFVRPDDMLTELIDDNDAMANAMRDARGLCERYEDTASTGLLENLIAQTERRRWFLFEMSREDDA